jgi:1,4-alpha-glucan branching enzyme
MSDPLGYQLLLLHAHLPFVRHPEFEEFLEEEWLYEAISETYLPVLKMLEGFERDGVRACFAMTLTPPLCEMLADPFLQQRYMRKLERLEELSLREVHRTQNTAFYNAALMYRDDFRECRRIFESWKGNLVQAFRHYQDRGFIEIITCGATHGFFPAMITPESIHAQIQVATANYRKHFGRAPKGIWVPECAYAKGVDQAIREAGIDYFFMDTHGIAFGVPRPRYGPYRPVYTPRGAAVFARDPESSRQVWSNISGYPGDPYYREFYKDIGYDAEYEYIKPYLHRDGVRRNVGLKYHRITGKVNLDEKQPYDPNIARERAATHAGNFLFNREQQVSWLHRVLGVQPLVISPYDAELFGHWWFEGPTFLDVLMRKMVYDQHQVELITPSRFLERHPRHQVIEPASCSWGDQGYYEVWLNRSNDWIYRHLHVAEVRMRELATRFDAPETLQERALKQAARELLLAQASDWAFIITAGTMVAYAEKRTKDHLHRFNGLYLQLTENRLEEPWIAQLESLDNIFSEIDYRVYVERK